MTEVSRAPKSKRTGLVSDERMMEHKCLWDPDHAENPKRYKFSLEKCKYYGLVDRCVNVPSRFADDDELKLIHSADYIDIIRNMDNVTDTDQLKKVSSDYDSIYFHPKTYECALLAAGSAIELVSQVIEGKIDNGLAIVRPPGHHAMSNEASGFCFFNSVALAAKCALTKYKVQKILIIDWDVHHGQGIQRLFYEDARVLYFSIHRYKHGSYWPKLKESNFDYIGSEPGKGFNINVPLNQTGLGNTEYLAIFNNILLPIAYEFNPELILISAGFDSALGCPKGQMEVTPHLYPHLLNLLSGLAGGRVCLILEGGYCLTSLSESLALCLRSLLGDPCPIVSPTDLIDDSVVESILNVISVQRPFWRSLHLQDVYKLGTNSTPDKKNHIVSIKFSGSPNQGKPYPIINNNDEIKGEYSGVGLESKLEELIATTDLTVPNQCTCSVIVRKLSASSEVDKTEVLSQCIQLPSCKASEADLTLAYTPDYISDVKAILCKKDEENTKVDSDEQTVAINHSTYDNVLLACGSLLKVVDMVLSKKCLNGLVMIPLLNTNAVDLPQGFSVCSVAAKYAQKKYLAKKILIINLDVHHGKSRSHIFCKDDNILSISFYHSENDSSKTDANCLVCKEDIGSSLGMDIHIPWSSQVSDGDYLAALSSIVLPVAYEFAPDFVIISPDFVSKNYPFGGCQITAPFYGHITKLLSGLAGGKIVLVLQDEYNSDSLSDKHYFSVCSLLGETCKPLRSGLFPSPAAVKTIQNAIRVQQKYWKCLQFDVEVPEVAGEISVEGSVVHDSSSSSVDNIPATAPNSSDSDANVQPGTRPPVSVRIPVTGGESLLMYCVSPLSWCPHLDDLQPLPPEGLNPSDPCLVCGDERENWVCLHCYQVYCGRFINQHMLEHGTSMQHFLTLSYTDLSVWCYSCEAYVRNAALREIERYVYMLKFCVFVG